MEDKTEAPKSFTLEQKVNALTKEVMRLLQLRGDALEISNLKKALGEE